MAGPSEGRVAGEGASGLGRAKGGSRLYCPWVSPEGFGLLSLGRVWEEGRGWRPPGVARRASGAVSHPSLRLWNSLPRDMGRHRGRGQFSPLSQHQNQRAATETISATGWGDVWMRSMDVDRGGQRDTFTLPQDTSTWNTNTEYWGSREKHQGV